MTSRRQRYDVIKAGPTWSTDVLHVRSAFINGEYVPVKGTRLVPSEAPKPTRNETNSKPRRRD